jgi:hypothetical protein
MKPRNVVADSEKKRPEYRMNWSWQLVIAKSPDLGDGFP